MSVRVGGNSNKTEDQGDGAVRWPIGHVCAIYGMMVQIPYSEIGIGVTIILGIWAFFVAETGRARAVIAGIPVLASLLRLIFPSPAGRLISLLGWLLYGIGCIIYLRCNGLAVR